MVDTREKFRELLNDIAERDRIKTFVKLAEMTGISVNTFTNIKKNEVKEVSLDTFRKLNSAFGNRYNIEGTITKRCHDNGINTVGDLIRCGGRKFRTFKNVGGSTITKIDDALENYYEVTDWYKM